MNGFCGWGVRTRDGPKRTWKEVAEGDMYYVITKLNYVIITNLRSTNHKLSRRLKMVHSLFIEVLCRHNCTNDMLHQVSTKVFHWYLLRMLHRYHNRVNSQRYTRSFLHPVFTSHLQHIILLYANLSASVVDTMLVKNSKIRPSVFNLSCYQLLLLNRLSTSSRVVFNVPPNTL